MNSINYAAIDIGSNALRLLIMNVLMGDEKEVRFHKSILVRAPIRLGKDVFTDLSLENRGKKSISSHTREKMVKAIKSYALLMQVYDVKDYLAYATSAMREAVNAKQVIEYIRKETSINIEIIDGDKEASLIFNSELKKYIDRFDTCLYMDVGGGSTELTLFSNQKMIASKSFSIGTVRMLKGLLGEEEMKNEFKAWIELYAGGFRKIDLIATGGNINHVLKQSAQKDVLNLDYLKTYLTNLSSLSYEERIWKYHMKADRADVIIHALNIYLCVMRAIGADKIFVPKVGLADGMIYHLYEKNHGNIK